MPASKLHCVAIDLGATSGRVIVGTWTKNKLTLTEVHRFPNAFASLNGHDYWNLPGLWSEIQTGLRKAADQFKSIDSVGVDTWGVDHVLLDSAGRLVFPTHAYRDARTQSGAERLAANPRLQQRIYTATGIPTIFYNTSLQLAETVAAYPALRTIASRCLFLPDYFNFLLSGRMVNETSIASTSQLLDVRRLDWSHATLSHFGIPVRWFDKPTLANKILGPVIGLPGWKHVQSVVVPGHDTAAAYAAMPAHSDGRDLYLSSGTWSLMGFESSEPVLGLEALRARISNERMGDGRFRPLTNIIGLWLLEQTLKDFSARPRNQREWAHLLRAAMRAPAPTHLLDLADPNFVNPPSMRAAIDEQLSQSSQLPKNLAAYVRLICVSLGAGHAAAARSFAQLSGRRFKRILMVGGGARNPLLCQATADASGLPVQAFSLEGSAVGNIASQLIALGAVKDLPAFRRSFANQLEATTYQPLASP
jgi:Sugar (pentulose and hexulose) kinases